MLIAHYGVCADMHACVIVCAVPGQRELQVLDYQNVAQTLIGLTASAYACWFMGQNMQARYQK